MISIFGLLQRLDALALVNTLFRLFERLTAPHTYSRLPFRRGDCWRNSEGPLVVGLTEKEARRCIEAMEWYIESFAPEMEARGLDNEIGRYEDLMYRFMCVPDKNVPHNVSARKADRLQ